MQTSAQLILSDIKAKRYAATITMIMTAVSDSRRAIDRRFEVLVEVLEKKGVL